MSQHNKKQVQISSLNPDVHSRVKDDHRDMWMETGNLRLNQELGGASSSSTMQKAEAEDSEEDSEEDCVY